MPDHVLPPVSRPHVTFDQSVEDQLQGRDVLLGVPDRTASASAPPDLEISSRSLFAFKADYSGIFSDIRMDEDYESFYNDNAERSKLPPPLPPSAIANSTASSLRPPRDTLPRQQPSSSSSSSRLPLSSVSSSVPPLPPRAPAAQNTVYPISVPAHPTPLTRHDSDASFEDLFRESRSLHPLPNTTAYNNAYREDHARVSDLRQTQHSVSQLDQGTVQPSDRAASVPHPSSSPPPPSSSPNFKSSQVPHRPEAQRKADVKKNHVRIPSRQPSPPPKPVHSESAQQQNFSAKQAEQRSTLWKLEQLSLNERTEEVNAATTAAPSYAPIPTSYDSGNHYTPSYGYGQGTHAGPEATAAVAAAVAAAAVQHSSQSPYLAGTNRTMPGQDWSSPHSGLDSGHAQVSPYDRADAMVSPFITPNGGAMTEMFSIESSDDHHVYPASPQPLPGVTYPAISAYRDVPAQLLSASRAAYLPQHGSTRGGSRGRNNSSHRMDSSGSGYGYGLYGSGNSRSSAYADVRGRAVPISPEYLNAQAAAAAAAAAAAVYQRNGVHINSPSGLGSLRSNGSAITSVRGLPSRRNGDSRRGLAHHQDGYSRGSNGSMHRANISERGIVDRGNGHNDSISSNASSVMKFSSFSDVVGRAEELARDQHGCRFLQTKLEEGNVVYINSIFEECYEKFVDLMTDPFGNYLCQKLFEFCNDAQRLALVERCAPAIPHVSTNMHGTRAVQRMVECLSTPEQVQAVCNALRPAAVSLMKDINGNHVIQRCLQRMEPAHNQFVYDAVAANCFELATHRHGCCVMQRCVDYAAPMQRNQLVQQINANALPLVQNAFGNYVVQYVLDLNDPVYTTEIIRRLRGHLADLSRQKFSSNVVEKGLQLGSRETRRELIEELISDQETMRRLLHDAYGNYVIQRAMEVAEGPQLERISEAIRPHLHSLKQSPYGKRIQAKIVKRMPKAIGALPPPV